MWLLPITCFYIVNEYKTYVIIVFSLEYSNQRHDCRSDLTFLSWIGGGSVVSICFISPSWKAQICCKHVFLILLLEIDQRKKQYRKERLAIKVCVYFSFSCPKNHLKSNQAQQKQFTFYFRIFDSTVEKKLFIGNEMKRNYKNFLTVSFIKFSFRCKNEKAITFLSRNKLILWL